MLKNAIDLLKKDRDQLVSDISKQNKKTSEQQNEIDHMTAKMSEL